MLYVKSKAKNITSNQEKINELVFKTIFQMAEIVGKTLGPSGRPVLIEREGLAPYATKDGATVVKSLGSANAEINLIIDSAKELSIKTAVEAGDGTSTALLLASSIVKHGQLFLKENPKYNPQKMVRELGIAFNQQVVPFLKKNAVKTETEEQLFYVARISANGDEEIAHAAVEAVTASGDNGHVLIQENKDVGIRVEIVDGFVVTSALKDLGQIGPVFINDKSNQQVMMDDGLVVLYDGILNDMLVPAAIQSAVADAAGQYDGRPIIVFAHGFADSVLEKFAKITKGGSIILPIKTPRSGLPNGASMFLHDLAAYTGAVVFDPGNVDRMERCDLGTFKNAKVNMYETFIYSYSNPEAIEARIQELKSIEKTAFSEFDRAFLRAAIAKLTGGISTIWVGGSSDLEAREKKDRVEDAVEAVRSAIAEGIVPGGCVMQLQLSHLLKTHPDKKPSWDILAKALTEPFTLLLSNGGEDVEEIYPQISYDVEQIDRLPNCVFNADEHEIVKPFEAGIIEPAKVTRVSLENALSVATLLITLGGIVCVERDANIEAQMELASAAFKNMTNQENE